MCNGFFFISINYQSLYNFFSNFGYNKYKKKMLPSPYFTLYNIKLVKLITYSLNYHIPDFYINSKIKNKKQLHRKVMNLIFYFLFSYIFFFFLAFSSFFFFFFINIYFTKNDNPIKIRSHASNQIFVFIFLSLVNF